MGCHTKFAWNYWKHHCYVCGLVVCSRCTSNSLFSRNRNRRCQNSGSHQNREIACLKRRIEFGNHPSLKKMMMADPEPELIRNRDGTYTWTKDYQPAGGSKPNPDAAAQAQLPPPSGTSGSRQRQPAPDQSLSIAQIREIVRETMREQQRS